MCDFRICSESALEITFEVYLTTSACRGVSSCGAIGEPAKGHLRLSQGLELYTADFPRISWHWKVVKTNLKLLPNPRLC